MLHKPMCRNVGKALTKNGEVLAAWGREGEGEGCERLKEGLRRGFFKAA